MNMILITKRSEDHCDDGDDVGDNADDVDDVGNADGVVMIVASRAAQQQKEEIAWLLFWCGTGAWMVRTFFLFPVLIVR